MSGRFRASSDPSSAPSRQPLAGAWRPSRRGVLSGLTVGLAQAAAPWRAALGATPPRLLVLVTGGWIPEDHYLAHGDASGFDAGPVLKVLDAYHARTLIVDKLVDHGAARNANPSDAHAVVGNYLLTGGGDASIDQVIADAVGPGISRRTVNLGMVPEKNHFIRHKGNTIKSEIDPRRVYQFLFEGLGGMAGNPDVPVRPPLTEIRRLAYRHAAARADELGAAMSKTVASQVSVYRSGLLELENALPRLGGGGAAGCTPYTAGQGLIPLRDVNDTKGTPDRYATLVGAQLDAAVAAMVCGLTNVATVLISHDDGHPKCHYQFAGLSGGYKSSDHDVSHDAYGNKDGDARTRKRLINIWYAGQVKKVLDTLDSVPDGDGSMLDDTLVVWVPAWGSTESAHTMTGMPAFLFGNVRGRLKMGRRLSFDNRRAMNDLWLAVRDVFGAKGAFGNPAYGSTPLPGLTG